VVRFAVREGRLACAHDISDGGLARALAESAIAGGLGCRADLQPLRERGCAPDAALFGEGTGGFLVSGERAALEQLDAAILGVVGGVGIEIVAGDRRVALPLGRVEQAWRSLERRMDAA
jgi:phosphoribosylformylglycinamidine synthase